MYDMTPGYTAWILTCAAGVAALAVLFVGIVINTIVTEIGKTRRARWEAEKAKVDSARANWALQKARTEESAARFNMIASKSKDERDDLR